MIRRWIFRILNEALESHLISFHRNLDDDLNLRFAIIQAQIEALASKVGEAVRQQQEANELTAHDGTSAQAVANSRPSWPRMKRHLEERDVRKIIEEQQNSSDFSQAKSMASRFNDEAARIESYWKHKSARVSEPELGYHGIEDLEKGL